MTEEEWNACADHPRDLLEHLEGRSSHRKWRLFICGCCRRVWGLLEESHRTAVTTAEQYADGLATDAQVNAAQQPLFQQLHDQDRIETRLASGPLYIGWKYEFDCAVYATADCADASGQEDLEYAAQAQLLKDIFGNPFRPVTIHPTWNNGTVRSLAQAIYDERAFDRMPILADALEDAGCTNQEILTHCRAPSPHTRGCWLVDLLLGKE